MTTLKSPSPKPDLCEALVRIASASPGVWPAAVVTEIVRLLTRPGGLFWAGVLVEAIFFDSVSQRRREAFVVDGEDDFFDRWSRRHGGKGGPS